MGDIVNRGDFLMINGRITSYVPEKKYGYINGEDSQYYWFHIDFIKESDRAKAKPEMHVQFDPTPGPKGLKAKKITFISQRKCYKNPSDGTVIVLKIGQNIFKNKEVVFTLGTVKSESRDPDEAIRYLMDQARESGCNGVINLKRETFKGSEGNYIFSVHRFVAEIALIKEVYYSSDINCSMKNEEELAKEIKRIKTYEIKDKVYINYRRIYLILFVIGIYAIYAFTSL
jgi:cold shock CspA family protein/uncharacterized protein YbjQ (UPF0145 family)